MNPADLKILLGSGSPRRKSLMHELGFRFRVVTSNTPEIAPTNLSEEKIAEYLSDEKATVLIDRMNKDDILVTADTIVWTNNKMLGKPADKEEAFSMLKMLNAKEHQVYTAVTLVHGKMKKTFSVRSDVKFRLLSDDEIRKYIDYYNPLDKAGAYGAQEGIPDVKNFCSIEEKYFLKKLDREYLYQNIIASDDKKKVQIIENIRGSFFNVMGLPIVELYHELEKLSSTTLKK